MASINLSIKTTLDDLLHATAGERRFHLVHPVREQAREIVERHLRVHNLPLRAVLDTGNEGPHVKLIHHEARGRNGSVLNGCFRFRKGQAEQNDHDGHLEALEDSQSSALLQALTAAYAEFERVEATARHPDV